MEEMYENMPTLISQVRLVEAGVIHKIGDEFEPDIVEYDRLVFVLAKEWVLPVGGWQELPEPLFSDVDELRG